MYGLAYGFHMNFDQWWCGCQLIREWQSGSPCHLHPSNSSQLRICSSEDVGHALKIKKQLEIDHLIIVQRCFLILLSL